MYNGTAVTLFVDEQSTVHLVNPSSSTRDKKESTASDDSGYSSSDLPSSSPTDSDRASGSWQREETKPPQGSPKPPPQRNGPPLAATSANLAKIPAIPTKVEDTGKGKCYYTPSNTHIITPGLSANWTPAQKDKALERIMLATYAEDEDEETGSLGVVSIHEEVDLGTYCYGCTHAHGKGPYKVIAAKLRKQVQRRCASLQNPKRCGFQESKLLWISQPHSELFRRVREILALLFSEDAIRDACRNCRTEPKLAAATPASSMAVVISFLRDFFALDMWIKTSGSAGIQVSLKPEVPQSDGHASAELSARIRVEGRHDGSLALLLGYARIEPVRAFLPGAASQSGRTGAIATAEE